MPTPAAKGRSGTFAERLRRDQSRHGCRILARPLRGHQGLPQVILVGVPQVTLRQIVLRTSAPPDEPVVEDDEDDEEDEDDNDKDEDDVEGGSIIVAVKFCQPWFLKVI